MKRMEPYGHITHSSQPLQVIIAAHLAILPRESVDVTPLAARFVEVLEEAVQDWARQRRQLELLLQHGAAGEEGDGEGSGAEIRDGGAFRMPEGVSDVEDDASSELGCGGWGWGGMKGLNEGCMRSWAFVRGYTLSRQALRRVYMCCIHCGAIITVPTCIHC